MRFPLREIHSPQDAQANFEYLESLFNGPIGVALPFLQLLSTQKLQLAHGIANIGWPGASHRSNNIVVPHGLGRTPATVVLTMQDSAEVSVAELYAPNDAINLYPTAYAVDGTNPANTTVSIVHWLAIG